MTERIWIMGASEGIGAALAKAWAGRDVQLVLSARSEDKLTQLAAELGDVEVVPCDVSNLDDLQTAASQILAGGQIDRAITLAALYDPGKVMQIDTEQADRIVAVNLTGSFNFTRVAVPLLKPGGQLALTGSVAGYIGLPQGQIYSATKAAVINLAESLRAELGASVDVRLINPGFVDTRMTRKNNFDMPSIMQPDDAARAILRGLHRRGFEIHFPRRLTLPLKLLSLLPYPLAIRLTRRLVN